MTTGKVHDDLFGGLSDSDEEQIEFVRHKPNVLEDLEMSSEDELFSKGGQSSSSTWENLADNEKEQSTESSPEGQYNQPEVIFTLSSGDEDSNGAPLKIGSSQNSHEPKPTSVKRSKEMSPQNSAQKRPKHSEFHRAMSALEDSSSVESLTSIENVLPEENSSSDWLTVRVPTDVYDRGDHSSSKALNQQLDSPLLESKEKKKKIPSPQATPKIPPRRLELSSLEKRPVPLPPLTPLTPLASPFLARENSMRPRVLIEDTEETRRMKETILLANFSREQLDRYEAFRRSTFKKSLIKKVIMDVSGTVPSDRLVLTMRSLTKMFVGDLVEEAVQLREARGESDKPVKPEHIRIVFRDLVGQGKLWPPFGHKS